jgi:outer membrane protein assembly factor BamB
LPLNTAIVRDPQGETQTLHFQRYFFAKSPRREIIMTNFTLRKWFNLERVIIISCSGMLLLFLSIPVLLVIKLIGSRPSVQWHYPVGNTVMAAPIISEETIYFGSLKDFKPSVFYAFDALSGEETWKKSLGGSVTTSPVITNEMLYFCTDDGFCYGVDKNTGHEHWVFGPEQRDLNVNACDSCALKFSQPIFDNNVIYAGSLDHNLYALDSQTGTLKWSFSTNGGILDAPSISDGKVYLGSNDGNIYVIDAKTGLELLRFPVPVSSEGNSETGIYATPLVDSTTIYAVHGPLTALDIQSGNIRWQFHSQSPLEQIIGNPIMLENSIIAPTMDALYAVDKAGGETVWKFSAIEGGVFFSPILEDGSIYFGDSSGYLYVLNADTGRQVRKYNMNLLDVSSYFNSTAEFVFQPAIEGNMIYVGWNNELYAIGNDQ